MRFDTIIIGGGLSGLIAGISLAKKGEKPLIVSSGQSALHFFSGSFELFGNEGNPLDEIAKLDSSHPYGKMGVKRVGELAQKVKPLFAEIGIKMVGENNLNHYRITPIGLLKPAWLTMDEYITVPADGKLGYKEVAIFNMEGFLDFHTDFVLSALAKRGVKGVVHNISMPQLERLRKNPTEMRATNIAKTLKGELIDELARQINQKCGNADFALLPTVMGLEESSEIDNLKNKVEKPLHFLATIPPSVPGIRMQIILRRYFRQLGGTYLLGDNVKGGEIADSQLKYIYTNNHGEMKFESSKFILATGSFFSHGIESDSTRVYEPILGLDIESTPERFQWYDRDVFKAQPYMKFGVKTDNSFRVMKDGNVIENLYAAGSVLSGFNAIKEGCGAGVSILTALDIVDKF